MRRGATAIATAAAVLGALVLAVPAGAAFTRDPIDLGPSDGEGPSVVMDPRGTAHAVWGVAEELMHYCALPRGARSCARTVPLALDARDGRPTILRRASDGLLVVVVGRDDSGDDPDESIWAFTSADGVAWSSPVPIAHGLDGPHDAVLSPDGQAVDLIRGRAGDGVMFQRAPLIGPPVATQLNLSSTPAGGTSDFDDAGQLLALRSGRTMALLAGIVHGLAYRVLRGGDAFSDPAWTPWPAARITREDDAPRGAAGPRGAYLMYARGARAQIGGAPPQVVRRFRGARWGRPRGVFREVAANTDRTALAQDGRGRLHAAIVGETDGGDRWCVAYARTSRKRWFSRAASLHQTVREADEPGPLRLAVDRRGRGVVAWATRGEPGLARAQRLRKRGGLTRPTGYFRRSCPPFPR